MPIAPRTPRAIRSAWTSLFFGLMSAVAVCASDDAAASTCHVPERPEVGLDFGIPFIDGKRGPTNDRPAVEFTGVETIETTVHLFLSRRCPSTPTPIELPVDPPPTSSSSALAWRWIWAGTLGRLGGFDAPLARYRNPEDAPPTRPPRASTSSARRS